MPYSETDLSVLQVLFDLAQLEGTAYVELHPGEPPDGKACWIPGSLFIRDAGFDFFVECFFQAHPKFDYFAFVRFDAGHVASLKAALSAFLGTLLPGADRAVVFARYSSLFGASIWKAVPTENLRVAVLAAGTEILHFIERQLRPGDPLWVLGM